MFRKLAVIAALSTTFVSLPAKAETYTPIWSDSDICNILDKGNSNAPRVTTRMIRDEHLSYDPDYEFFRDDDFRVDRDLYIATLMDATRKAVNSVSHAVTTKCPRHSAKVVSWDVFQPQILNHYQNHVE